MMLPTNLHVIALLVALRLSGCWAYEPVQNLPACTRTPPGSQFICGQNGSVKPAKGPIFTYHNVTSVAACHLECIPQEKYVPMMELSVPSCYSVGYDAQAQTCSGYLRTLKQIKFIPDTKSTTTFYDSQCFMCIYDTPPPQGSNLVANGGFQTPTSSHLPFSPWSDFSGILQLISPGYRSTKALQNQGNRGFFTRQALIDPVRGYYDFTFDYKFQVSGGIPFLLNPSTSDNLNQHPYDTHLMQPPAINNNTWSKFKGTMEMGAFTSQAGQPWFDRIIYADIDGARNGVKLIVDNVKITPAQLPFQSKSGAPNLIKNGGFETGSLQGFTLNYHGPNENGTQNKTFSFVPSGVSGSKYALQLDPSKLKLGIAGYYFEIMQDVPLKDGVDYLAGMKYRVVKGNENCAANLTTNKIYDLYLTVDDLTGIDNRQVHNQTGTYFQFRTNSFDNVDYVTYQLPIPSYSSFSQRSKTKINFRFGQCCGDTAPGCPLLIDEIFVRERA